MDPKVTSVKPVDKCGPNGVEKVLDNPNSQMRRVFLKTTRITGLHMFTIQGELIKNLNKSFPKLRIYMRDKDRHPSALQSSRERYIRTKVPT